MGAESGVLTEAEEVRSTLKVPVGLKPQRRPAGGHYSTIHLFWRLASSFQIKSNEAIVLLQSLSLKIVQVLGPMVLN